VFDRLINRARVGTFDITALVRSPEKAKKLEAFGVHGVVGQTSETEKLQGLVSEADFVFSTADADDLNAVKVILKGMKQRYDSTGNPPILIHTSGTGVLTTNDNGEFATETIWNDADPKQIESLEPTQMHRDVDLTILEADSLGYIKSYIILPSTIYGIASNPLVDAGIQNPYSQQIPTLIKAALARGQAGVVGKGHAMWPNVHNDEIADLYDVLFTLILAEPSKPGHGREGFYFGENGEHTWYDISKAIGVAMVKLGLSKSVEPTPFTEEELGKYFGSKTVGYYFGTNSRCRANRSKAIGWKPKKTTDDMLKSIKLEMEVILKQQKA